MATMVAAAQSQSFARCEIKAVICAMDLKPYLEWTDASELPKKWQHHFKDQSACSKASGIL